jgi:hypothetical protein
MKSGSDIYVFMYIMLNVGNYEQTVPVEDSDIVSTVVCFQVFRLSCNMLSQSKFTRSKTS